MKLGEEIGVLDIKGTPIKIGDTVVAYDHPKKYYKGTVRWNKRYLMVDLFGGKFVWDSITMGNKNPYEIINEEVEKHE